ncbi:hypothetical protein EV122DRAFT_255293 [Schizophyllum commune]
MASSPSAAERAEARRRAILSRGSDRLSKLKTTAHGEGSAYLKEDRPLHPMRSQFMGEDSSMPPPSRGTTPFRDSSPSPFTSPSPAPAAAASPAPPDPNVWSQEEQSRFMQALMAGAGGPGLGPPPASTNSTSARSASDNTNANPRAHSARSPSAPPQDNPLAALMSMAGGGAPGAGMEGLADNPLLAMMSQMGFDPSAAAAAAGPQLGQQQQTPRKPPTRLQRALPLIHAVAVWALLAYFVFLRPTGAVADDAPFGGGGFGGLSDGWSSWADPSTWANTGAWIAWDPSKWRRGGTGWWPWAQLARRAPEVGVWEATVGVQPFVYAFLVLEMLLHSFRILSRTDNVRPPALLQLALPHLPPALSSTIVHGMKYLQMGGLVLDDVAFLVMGLAFLVVLAGWMA